MLKFSAFRRFYLHIVDFNVHLSRYQLVTKKLLITKQSINI